VVVSDDAINKAGNNGRPIATGCDGQTRSVHWFQGYLDDSPGALIDRGVIVLPALNHQSPLSIQRLWFSGTCPVRGSGASCGSGPHLPRASLIA
jgi:hypothetical protein